MCSSQQNTTGNNNFDSCLQLSFNESFDEGFLTLDYIFDNGD